MRASRIERNMADPASDRKEYKRANSRREVGVVRMWKKEYRKMSRQLGKQIIREEV